MNVIGHDHKRMQLVAMKSDLTRLECACDQFGDLNALQERRAVPCSVKDPIHGHECLAAGQLFWGEDAIPGKRAEKAERYEDWLPDDIPMRQPAFIIFHM